MLFMICPDRLFHIPVSISFEFICQFPFNFSNHRESFIDQSRVQLDGRSASLYFFIGILPCADSTTTLKIRGRNNLNLDFKQTNNWDTASSQFVHFPNALGAEFT
jgi:hypothetical protein